MLRKVFLFVFLWTVSVGVFSHSSGAGTAWDSQSRQLLIVTTDGWSNVDGTLHQFERAQTNASWKAVGQPIRVVVGRSGLAWGRGLHPTNLPGPQKVEGDGKSPAGVFLLSASFGSAPAEKMKALKLPYLHVTDALECVDDVKSSRYNSIVDATHIIDPDWHSSEKMREIGAQYDLGVIVDHNVSPRVAGKGSCIFLHVWKGDGSGTSGCTAMKKTDMEQLLHLLDREARPVLVQLPEAEFQQRQSDWNLPDLKTATQQ